MNWMNWMNELDRMRLLLCLKVQKYLVETWRSESPDREVWRGAIVGFVVNSEVKINGKLEVITVVKVLRH